MKKLISLLLCAILGLLPVCACATGDKEETQGFSAVSPYVMFVDMNTGRVMYEKNADEKIYPASTVKIMTAILAIENCNLEDKITASDAALAAVPEGVTVMDIMPGETLTVRQLLYGAMLASAADATNVLAEAVSGSVELFVKLMNKKASELGMKNTNFSNTHGEHDDRTYTTVRDMAVLARYAMQDEDFREIVQTERYAVPPTEKYKEERDLVNTNYMVSRVRRGDYYYSRAIGVKAGYTTEAKSCLVEVAKKGDMELLALVFGAESVDGRAQGYVDCRSFFETTFENYKLTTLVKKGTLLDQVTIKNAKRANTVLLEAQENLYYMYPSGEEKPAPTTEVTKPDYVKAPVSKGDVIGECEYFVDGESVGSVKLVANKEYKFAPIAFVGDSIMAIITSPIFIAAIVLIIVFVAYVRIKRRERRIMNRRRERARRRREAEKMAEQYDLSDD